jgi:hypothetical protein
MAPTYTYGGNMEFGDGTSSIITMNSLYKNIVRSSIISQLYHNSPAPGVMVDSTSAILAARFIEDICTINLATTARSKATPSAALILSNTIAVAYANVGDHLEITIIETGGSYALTITAGTGMTLVGSSVVAAGTSARFRIRFTNVTASSEAATMYRLS